MIQRRHDESPALFYAFSVYCPDRHPIRSIFPKSFDKA